MGVLRQKIASPTKNAGSTYTFRLRGNEDKHTQKFPVCDGREMLKRKRSGWPKPPMLTERGKGSDEKHGGNNPRGGKAATYFRTEDDNCLL
jgi:hypothetical protein